MATNEQSVEILVNILDVLKGIEKKLDQYENRLQKLESTEKHDIKRTKSFQEKAREVSARQENVQDASSKAEPKILYSEWHTNFLIERLPTQLYSHWSTFSTNLDEFLDLRLSEAIEARIGDCFNMPDDDRLPLKFFKSNILKPNLVSGMSSTRTTYHMRRPFERELGFLCEFDEKLRLCPGNDFMVIDFDAQNSSRLYRVGEKAVGPDLMVNLEESGEAPWSRIILYQGATTGSSIEKERTRPEQPIPYFTRNDRINGVWGHISSHLTLNPRATNVNPYLSSPWTGFHTTFYEICSDAKFVDLELWKHGPLYQDPLGRHFRKCAFTLYSPLSVGEIERNSRVDEEARYWTILILSPSGFFEKDKNRAFPMQELGVGESQNLGHAMGRMSRLGAEMALIGYALEKIGERWSEFQAFFDFILDSGDSLMQPNEHDNLLFDDGAFSRSRKYFWAIDCLGEFDNCICDNLTQWELYKNARVPQDRESLSQLDHNQLRHADRQSSILQNQRDGMQKKLAATRALRDALFNASAVIESRASTRLGEHVKLLTFVSIFFLPLAFVSSLWSVIDKFSTTALIYVIIIVALSTYFVMFNISNLASGFDGLYSFRKRRIIRAMKRDRREEWQKRGKRFEVFRPKAENPEPSEWYIPFYALMHPGSLLGLSAAKPVPASSPDPESETVRSGRLLSGLKGLFRRKRSNVDPKGKEVPDEAWVM